MKVKKTNFESPATRAFKLLKKEKEWTITEKQNLLTAMRMHGINDIKSLHPAVPNRSLGELKNYLNKLKKDGIWRVKDPVSAPPLEQWLVAFKARDHLGNIHCHGQSRKISRVFQLIAETEMHPPPELCNGVNYYELYNFLAQILSGIHPTQVSQPTAQVIHQSCLWLASLPIHKDISKYADFLARVSRTPAEETTPIKRTYSRKPIVTERLPTVGGIFSDLNFNPLLVPMELLPLDPADTASWNRPQQYKDQTPTC